MLYLLKASKVLGNILKDTNLLTDYCGINFGILYI